MAKTEIELINGKRLNDTTARAEAAKNAEAIAELKKNQGSGGNGDLTPELKTALINYYTHVLPTFDDTNGLAYVNAILTALGAETRGEPVEPEKPEEPETPVEPEEPETPEVTMSGISATYSGGDVAVGTAVSALTGIVVTAHYSDGTSETVTGYTLSGEIAEGENTVTVSYGGKTATFTVTGVVESSFVPVHTEGVSGINWFTKNQSYVEIGGVDANKTWSDQMVEPDNGYKVNVTNTTGLTGIGGMVYTLAWPLTSGKKYIISIENIGTIETYGSVWVGKLATLPVKGEIVTSENTVDTVVHSFKWLKVGESASAEYTAGDNEWLFTKINYANQWTIIAEVTA